MSAIDLMIVQDTRDRLIALLNEGHYNPNDWQALLWLAREWNFHAIASQVEGYINHYSEEDKCVYSSVL